ncbi:glycine cleavage system H protein, mitochondrial precursor [Thraustotheca clavata]|uniref:Glycine cleavage system H protein n=1 Tax=Thraustotheca clavata TaxID=74557 RepID=A0A1V9ZWQ1_9STRA|nr:glycine cleavage system H protein, mitochondrial precursor [Thraustotheca clavata]
MLSRVFRRAPVFARRAFSTKYTPQHEYLTIKGDEGTIGITDFAQNALGDVVYVDLPKIGEKFSKGDSFGSVESVKAASDVYVPVSGEVIAINENLVDSPNLVNESPLEDGWFIKIKLSDAAEATELLDEEAYKTHCENEDH